MPKNIKDRHLLEPSETKVLVGLSGGTNSTVVAALLRNQGYELSALHIRFNSEDDSELKAFQARCCKDNHHTAVEELCTKFDIPLHVVDVGEEFKNTVIDNFVHEYIQHRIPVPCIRCDTMIKLKYLFNRAQELEYDLVATGHYVQVRSEPVSGLASIHRAVDKERDQSYFLYPLEQEKIVRLMTPLGGLSKDMVRKLAYSFDLETFDEARTRLCFVGSEGYQNFIEKRVAKDLRPTGLLRNLDGSAIGEHHGFFRHHIGQQDGLKLNVKDKKNQLFVVGFDNAKNDVVLGPERLLMQDKLIAKHLSWVKPVDTLRGVHCHAQVSPAGKPEACDVTLFENQLAHVHFEKPIRAIQPGQAIVFFRDTELLGGGIIDRVVHEEEEEEDQKQKGPLGSPPAKK